MKTLLLIGGGGQCRAAIDVIEAEGQFRILGVVRPEAEGKDSVLNYPILGDDRDLPNLLRQTSYAMITVGQIKTSAPRRNLYELLKGLKAELPVIISPQAYVSRHATIQEGTLVMHGAVINAGAQLGRNGIVNSLALVEHDAVIGDHCHISTGARINGGVIVEDGCFIGSGAVIREGLRIGANSVIGAGCVVTRQIDTNTLVKANS
ncbi:MAG: acetyltransferase [Bdellovibrionota bacterium]